MKKSNPQTVTIERKNLCFSDKNFTLFTPCPPRPHFPPPQTPNQFQWFMNKQVSVYECENISFVFKSIDSTQENNKENCENMETELKIYILIQWHFIKVLNIAEQWYLNKDIYLFILEMDYSQFPFKQNPFSFNQWKESSLYFIYEKF